MKKTTNSWSEGLIMDFAPENASPNSLTSALNATLITYNGNENMLQNDMGNGRIETAFLPEGYIPVGTCEYGDIIYIVSYNPLTNKSQIGCFPSPERNISSEEIGQCNQTLSFSDFQEVRNGALTGKLKATSVKKIIFENNLHPGDKYFIYDSSNAQTTDYKTKFKNFSDFEGNGVNSFPKYLKIHVISIEESGKIKFLDSSVKWYDDYFIPQITKTSEGKADIDSYRDALQSGYSIFSSKISGKLALLVELEKITGFSCTYSILKKDPDLMNNIQNPYYAVYWNIGWSTENNDVNPSYIVLTKSEVEKLFNTEETPEASVISVPPAYSEDAENYWYDTISTNLQLGSFEDYQRTNFESQINDPKLNYKNYYKAIHNKGNNEITPGQYYLDAVSVESKNNTLVYKNKKNEEISVSTIKDDIINNYFQTTVYKQFANFQIGDYIYKYEITPAMAYGLLPEYAVQGQIDFSKIGQEIIKINGWRYYNTENSSTLTLSLEAYTEEGKGINGIVLEFYDAYGKAAAYHIDNKESYAGTFTEYLPLNSINAVSKLNNEGLTGEIIKHKGLALEQQGIKRIEEGTLYEEDNILYRVLVDNTKPNFTKEDGNIYIKDPEILFAYYYYDGPEKHYFYKGSKIITNDQGKFTVTTFDLDSTGNVIIENGKEKVIPITYTFSSKKDDVDYLIEKEVTNNDYIVTTVNNKNIFKKVYTEYLTQNYKESEEYNIIICPVKIGEESFDNTLIHYSDFYSNDAGVLYSNILYGVKITIKNCNLDALGNFDNTDTSSFITEYRWMWTNQMLNSQYNSVIDFKDAVGDLNLDIGISYNTNDKWNHKQYKIEDSLQTVDNADELYKNLEATVQEISGGFNIDSNIELGLEEGYNSFKLNAETLNNNFKLFVNLGESDINETVGEAANTNTNQYKVFEGIYPKSILPPTEYTNIINIPELELFTSNVLFTINNNGANYTAQLIPLTKSRLDKTKQNVMNEYTEETENTLSNSDRLYYFTEPVPFIVEKNTQDKTYFYTKQPFYIKDHAQIFETETINLDESAVNIGKISIITDITNLNFNNNYYYFQTNKQDELNPRDLLYLVKKEATIIEEIEEYGFDSDYQYYYIRIDKKRKLKTNNQYIEFETIDYRVCDESEIPEEISEEVKTKGQYSTIRSTIEEDELVIYFTYGDTNRDSPSRVKLELNDGNYQITVGTNLTIPGKIVSITNIITDEENYEDNEDFKNLQNALNNQAKLTETYCFIETNLQKVHKCSFKRFSKEKNYSIYSNPILVGFDSTLEGINTITADVKSNYFIEFETFDDGDDTIIDLHAFDSDNDVMGTLDPYLSYNMQNAYVNSLTGTKSNITDRLVINVGNKTYLDGDISTNAGNGVSNKVTYTPPPSTTVTITPNNSTPVKQTNWEVSEKYKQNLKSLNNAKTFNANAFCSTSASLFENTISVTSKKNIKKARLNKDESYNVLEDKIISIIGSIRVPVMCSYVQIGKEGEEIIEKQNIIYFYNNDSEETTEPQTRNITFTPLRPEDIQIGTTVKPFYNTTPETTYNPNLKISITGQKFQIDESLIPVDDLYKSQDNSYNLSGQYLTYFIDSLNGINLRDFDANGEKIIFTTKLNNIIKPTTKLNTEDWRDYLNQGNVYVKGGYINDDEELNYINHKNEEVSIKNFVTSRVDLSKIYTSGKVNPLKTYLGFEALHYSKYYKETSIVSSEVSVLEPLINTVDDLRKYELEAVKTKTKDGYRQNLIFTEILTVGIGYGNAYHNMTEIYQNKYNNLRLGTYIHQHYTSEKGSPNIGITRYNGSSGYNIWDRNIYNWGQPGVRDHINLLKPILFGIDTTNYNTNTGFKIIHDDTWKQCVPNSYYSELFKDSNKEIWHMNGKLQQLAYMRDGIIHNNTGEIMNLCSFLIKDSAGHVQAVDNLFPLFRCARKKGNDAQESDDDTWLITTAKEATKLIADHTIINEAMNHLDHSQIIRYKIINNRQYIKLGDYINLLNEHKLPLTIADAMISPLSQIYKYNDTTKSLSTSQLSNVVFLDNQTTSFFKDVIYQFTFNKEKTNSLDNLIMLGVTVNDYKDSILTCMGLYNINPEKENEKVYTKEGLSLINDLNIGLNDITKNVPLQFDIKYVEPEIALLLDDSKKIYIRASDGFDYQLKVADIQLDKDCLYFVNLNGKIERLFSYLPYKNIKEVEIENGIIKYVYHNEYLEHKAFDKFAYQDDRIIALQDRYFQSQLYSIRPQLHLCEAIRGIVKGEYLTVVGKYTNDDNE